MTLVQFAARNAFRNRRRSLLTVVSVGVSLLLLTFLIAVWRGFYAQPGSPSAALRIMTRHKVGLDGVLPGFYREKIAGLEGVVATTPMEWVGGRYINDNPENQFAQFATDPDAVFQVYADWQVDPAQLQAWQRDRTGAAVQRDLAALHGWKLGDRIYLQANTWPSDFDLRVRAIFDAPKDWETVLIHDKYFSDSVPFMKDQMGIVALRVKDAPHVATVSEAIDAMFRNAPAPTRSESEKAFQLDFLAMMGNVKAFILGIAGAVVFTMLLVAGNTMAMTIRERTREVAVLKTLGFQRGTILGLFVGEGVTLALVGGLLGACGARGLLAGMAASPQGAMFAAMNVSGGVLLLALGAAALVGVVATLPPSWRASRREIVEGLRHLG